MKTYQIILCFLLALPGCNEKNSNLQPCSCSGTEVCTDQFVSVGIAIKDKNGKPYQLDSYQIKRVSTGQLFVPFHGSQTGYDSIAKASGNYILAADTNIKNIQKCGEDFLFTGIKNNKTVIENTYTIGHDCCHVKLLKGVTDIILE